MGAQERPARRADRFLQQSLDYQGEAKRIAWTTDRYGEKHVVIEMHKNGKPIFWLDWIGAEYAHEPDEWDCPPPDLTLIWKPIKENRNDL